MTDSRKDDHTVIESDSPRRAPRWRMLAGVVVSLALLALIISRLDGRAIAAALSQASPLGWLAATSLMGLGIAVSALRWRVASRAAGLDLSLAVVLRATFCGTFYNMLLLGPAGGDIAKSATYARWYDLPLPSLLAASVVDRGFSVGGSVLFFAGLVILVLGWGDWPTGLVGAQWDLGGVKLLGALAAVVVLALVAWRLARGLLMEAWDRFRESLKTVWQRPAMIARGCAYGFLGQAILSFVFAACLALLGEPGLPWLAMAWVFPLISAMAILPFTFSGVGAREGLGLLLLTPYGVPPEHVVAAGLLTASIYLAWAAIGGTLIALEWRRYAVSS